MSAATDRQGEMASFFGGFAAINAARTSPASILAIIARAASAILPACGE